MIRLDYNFVSVDIYFGYWYIHLLNCEIRIRILKRKKINYDMMLIPELHEVSLRGNGQLELLLINLVLHT